MMIHLGTPTRLMRLRQMGHRVLKTNITRPFILLPDGTRIRHRQVCNTRGRAMQTALTRHRVNVSNVITGSTHFRRAIDGGVIIRPTGMVHRVVNGLIRRRTFAML